MSITYAMSALLIAFGLLGHFRLAAEIGIIHAATLATFYALSANSRNLILNSSRQISTQDILSNRLLLIIPLALVSMILGVFVAGINMMLALALILRRCIEWINEVHLSEMEVKGNSRFAMKFLILQILLFALVMTLSLFSKKLTLAGMYLWAIMPLVMSARFAVQNFSISVKKFMGSFSAILPHFGSTATIGIGIYFFRLLIFLFSGKPVAGTLFTVFAIGSFSGTMFANVFGPSISMHETSTGRKYFPFTLKLILAGMCIVGLLIYFTTLFDARIFAFSTKPKLFWEGLGLSLIGGTIMVLAQRIRLKLLKLEHGVHVFGPDLFAHALLIMAVVYIYFTRGVNGFPILYLINASLLYLFYFTTEKGCGYMSNSGKKWPMSDNVRYIIALFLFLPIFFQLSGHIYHVNFTQVDSGGKILTVPIPFSVIACYGGVLFLSNYRKAFSGLAFIFLFFGLMLTTSILSTAGHLIQERAKLILLIQFLLPTFALVLGQLFEIKHANELIIEKTFFYVLLLIVPIQLLATWFKGYVVLTQNLYLFSIYQNFEYVPVIFISAFLIVLYSLWSNSSYRKAICFLALFIGIYAVASLSELAIFEMAAGVFIFTLTQYQKFRSNLTLAPLLLVLIATLGYTPFVKHDPRTVNKYDAMGTYGGGAQASGSIAEQERFKSADQFRHLPTNLALRLIDWEYYSKHIVANNESFLLGHGKPLSRRISTNAHNYYIDLLYNFGMIAALPVFILIGYLLYLATKLWPTIYSSNRCFALLAVVLFLVFVDSSFKVTLREPYPAIFTFFLWGVLFSRLKGLQNTILDKNP